MPQKFSVVPSGFSHPAAEPPCDQQPAELIDLILRSAHLLRIVLAPALAELGLNDARWAVLQAVQAGGTAGCSQTELAQELQHSESNISTLLERMRADGLVTRERSAFDRRKSLVQLTPGGQELLAQILGGPVFQSNLLFDTLSPGEQRRLRQTLAVLIQDWVQFQWEDGLRRPCASSVPEGVHGGARAATEGDHARVG
jgi:DNA-binding MarR family transcriptional regulator